MVKLEQRSVEVELKYQVCQDRSNTIEKLIRWLDTNATSGEEVELKNIYFDTPERLLNKHKMGLRIRRAGDWGEQTIKLAGKQQGAVSERPEYNVETKALRPDLHLFPTHIWPEHWRLKELNNALEPQFEVTFTRRTWLYHGEGYSAEIALDLGLIIAAGKQEAVQELELELKAGSAEPLLELGAELAALFQLEPGLKSKAQRGYELYAERFPSQGS
ncbi:hypothetical protein CWE15_09390 [Aliidiomarina taiwanensis]|uniref:CYTH domain-containing protein n=1 Tax=Aliidiomarina taiwanensis TaxID=946228 RepID=A0A432WZY1_9GAMM|nr:CYTH domain-containing protein [Aliidiomarina taiwanensis]RUO39330.1 hypothetical protein CWE15_09390 [Aliidiomarina taiwanensis]